ncbi:MAG: hypothetical protein ABTD50_04770 [Polyangiaceae bacterium]|jgi:hypothetical protein
MTLLRSQSARIIACVVLAGAVIAAAGLSVRNAMEGRNRERLFAAIRPVRLKNCTMKRFGHPHDGGYVMCSNLLGQVQSAYSYGIEGRDEWGCDIARQAGVPVHEYDCFDPRRPVCDGGTLLFQDECVGGAYEVNDKRVFDAVAHQIAKNGDFGKRLVVKMDVEGSEWDAFPAIPDVVLNTIDEMSVEFHHTAEPRFLGVIERLKKIFYIANVHFNNHSCTKSDRPFPSWAWEVLFVNKRVGNVDEADSSLPVPNPLDAPNKPEGRDCQATW